MGNLADDLKNPLRTYKLLIKLQKQYDTAKAEEYLLLDKLFKLSTHKRLLIVRKEMKALKARLSEELRKAPEIE